MARATTERMDALDLEARYQASDAILSTRGQQHALRWWPELTENQRIALLDDLESIPWDLLDGLIQSHVLGSPATAPATRFKPAIIHPHQPAPDQQALYSQAMVTGEALLRDAKVAAFTVAGGQGTRLGFDGPKGALPVTPVGNRSLFELFAQMIRSASVRYGSATGVIPWYVMTSRTNHDETVAFFEKHNRFGLPGDAIQFFQQRMLPALDFNGRLLLEAKHRIALAPDGHGGSLTALHRSGALADMQGRGIEVISYFQVDNPLVKPFDPLFLGLHAQTGSEMSTKVAKKADDLEHVGNVCLRDGKLTVVEYTEFPESLARARDPAGNRKFDAGNLAIHLLDVAFVMRIVESALSLPFRRAEKIVPSIDETGEIRRPEKPNAVKLESFVFDALATARNPLVLEVDRTEEFSPVKNATGTDSLATSQEDQNARACRWLELAGVSVPRNPDGTPAVTVAISPTLALSANDLKTELDRLTTLNKGDSVYLE